MTAEDIRIKEVAISAAPELGERIKLMFSLASGLVNIDASLALDYIKQIEVLSKDNNYQHGFGYSHLLQSAYCWFQGDMEKSLEHNEAAQKIFIDYENDLHLSITERLLGMIYSELGDYDKCLELYYHALRLQEKVNDTRQITSTLNNIATAQMKMGANEQGLISYKRAYDLFESLTEEDDQLLNSKAMVCTNIGQCYSILSDYETALRYNKKALDWALKIGQESRLVALVNYHIGTVFYKKKDYDNSSRYFHRALEVAKAINNRRLLMDVYIQLSMLCIAKEDFGAALKYALSHKELAVTADTNETTDVLTSHRQFASIYESMQDFQQATFHLHKVLELKEKFEIQDRVNQIKNKRVKHQLEKQKTQLQQSNADLSMFASIASHDMKAPLRSISSFLQILEKKNKDKFDDTDREFIAFAVNGAKHLERMIEDLLSYSKVDKNLGPAQLVNLNEVSTIVEYNLKSLVEERNATIQIGKLPSMLAHQSLMSQLIQNLVNNGIKYNRRPDPMIKITDVSTNAEIIITISDNGIGIPKDQEHKMFKMFQRLHGGKEFEGTGIGLATCKKIADHYRGRIWFESSDQGTTFYLAFPNSKHPQMAGIKF